MNRRAWRAVVWAAAWSFVAGGAAFYGASLALRARYGVTLLDTGGALRFAWPLASVSLLLVPLLWLAHGRAESRALPRLRLSTLGSWPHAYRGWRTLWVDLPMGLRAAALGLLSLAAMRPQSVHVLEPERSEGIDIVMALDLSRSMGATDIRPTRFEAMLAVVDDFVSKRRGDRIGVVIFGREAFTLLPPTTDEEAVRTTVSELRIGAIDGRGTAIGNALGTALNRLRRSDAKSKVVVLLTDGENNAGNLTPEQATAAAEALGVRVYTILMGRRRAARIRTGRDPFGRPLWEQGDFPVNPELLQKMARRTGGEFFHAADRSSLERSFHRILDQLEKTEIEEPERFYGELYPPFAAAGWILLLLEWCATWWLRRWR